MYKNHFEQFQLHTWKRFSGYGNQFKKDAKKLNRVFELYKLSISGHIEKTDQIVSLALQLQSELSIQNMDSLHIAAAEIGMADVFLTVDDRLIRSCKGLPLSIRIMNPIDFLKEV